MAEGPGLNDMVLVPGGTTTLGSDRFYPEERPVREVSVGDVWFDVHPVTNAEFARFVEETGHITVAEVSPGAADFPGADPAMLVPGSQLFRQTDGPVHLGDWTQWWRWQPGASWRCPQGPGTSWTGVSEHPVVHIGWEDAMAYARWADKTCRRRPSGSTRRVTESPAETSLGATNCSRETGHSRPVGGHEELPGDGHEAARWRS
jgi:formylglycine-generating enzyme required for sulfatase activity